jgi:two-component system, NarL family, sensor histidine kinase UhpB
MSNGFHEHEGVTMQFVPALEQPVSVHSSAWRDTLIVLAVTAISIALAAHFDWNEAIYALTRHEERFQLDELPIGMLVMLTGLMWLAWRRNRQARMEIRARQFAEEELGRALAANRELAGETLRIQEEDRKHLARELHDELGQYLNAIKLDAVFIKETASDKAADTFSGAEAIIRTVDRLHAVVSRMIADLRPVALDELGLVAAIEHNLEEWRRRLPAIDVRLRCTGDFGGLDEAASLTVYRLIQEALTNVCKHAGASQVDIALEVRRAGANEEIELEIFDDGRGMEPNRSTSGRGLRGMRERVELGGGRFALESAPDCGLRLTACLPASRRPS